MSDVKTCSKCLRSLPADTFYFDRGKLSSHCRPCKREYYTSNTSRARNAARMRHSYVDNRGRRLASARSWREANREQVRNSQLMRDYGITLADYEYMLLQQQGVCAICKSPPGKTRPLAVDHCHATMKVRALLCYRCNRNVALADDDRLLEETIRYVKEFRQ